MRKGVILLVVALVGLSSLVSANMAPLIQDLDKEILVCEASQFSLKFNVVEPDGDSLTIGTSPSGPFFIRQISSDSHLTEIELFSDNLTKQLADKTYEQTIFVSDGKNIDSKNILITVLETNNPPEIGHLSVETLDLSSHDKLRKQVPVIDQESGTPLQGDLSFEVSDPVNLLGLTVSEFGEIIYTAAEPHIGVHDITICVTDSGVKNIESKLGFCTGNSPLSTSCKKFQLAIAEENSPPSILAFNSSDLSNKIIGAQEVAFQIYKHEPEGIYPDTYWYVDNNLKEIDSGKSSDTFTYSFGCGSAGRHKIKSIISDGMFNDSAEWALEVVNVDCPSGVIPKESIIGAVCEEKWGCLDWGLCQNAVQSNVTNSITDLARQSITQECNANGWDESACGYQVRTCTDLNDCNSITKKPIEIMSCQFSLEPRCSDEIQNCHDGACEFLTDCGGPCPACPTCSDGIKNQGEEGIDRAGPCPKQRSGKQQDASEGGPILKQSMLMAIVIALVIAVIQIFKIIHDKNKLEEPSKREVTLTYE